MERGTKKRKKNTGLQWITLKWTNTRKSKEDDDNPGDQITGDKKKPAVKVHTMDSRLDENKKKSEMSIPTRKKVSTTKCYI